MKTDFRSEEKLFKALANRRRLQILAILKHDREANVGDIAAELRISFKATSKHLAVLSSADILQREQRSLFMFYSIASSLPPAAKMAIANL
jgi:ArsR family transcriptional regulator, arsenate/arsenite/antimonite-responsive transcriptional repressor